MYERTIKTKLSESCDHIVKQLKTSGRKLGKNTHIQWVNDRHTVTPPPVLWHKYYFSGSRHKNFMTPYKGTKFRRFSMPEVNSYSYVNIIYSVFKELANQQISLLINPIYLLSKMFCKYSTWWMNPNPNPVRKCISTSNNGYHWNVLI